jgi:hypothetical protein
MRIEENSIVEGTGDSSFIAGSGRPLSAVGFSWGKAVPLGTQMAARKDLAIAEDAGSPGDIWGFCGRGFSSLKYCFSRTSAKFTKPWGASWGGKLSGVSGAKATGKSKVSIVWISL